MSKVMHADTDVVNFFPARVCLSSQTPCSQGHLSCIRQLWLCPGRLLVVLSPQFSLLNIICVFPLIILHYSYLILGWYCSLDCEQLTGKNL